MMVQFPQAFSLGSGFRISWATKLALLGGVMLTVALPPFPATVVLAPLSLMLFFQALRISDHPGRTGFVFGVAHQVTLLHWLFFLDPSKSIPSRALVPVQALAAIGYVALFYCLLGYLFGRLARDRGLWSFWLLPVLWSGMEFLRGLGELGFPWCLSGAALVGSPWMALYRTAGELGVGVGFALVAATALALWEGRGQPRKSILDGGIPLLVGTALWWTFLVVGMHGLGTTGDGTASNHAPQILRVAAVQPNVSLSDKWATGKLDSTRIPLTRLTRLAAAGGTQFVVWPETAVPAYLRYDRDLLDWVRSTARDNHIALFTGFPDAERGPGGKVLQYNSSGLFSPQGNLVAQYAKHHLLPIGESMPFSRYLPFLSHIDVGQAEWTPGAAPQPMTLGDSGEGLSFSCLICFESAFSHMARLSVLAGSRLLVIITNDGWFGNSAGPVQHAFLARIRAVENGVPVIRCANNGISFICDDKGAILDLLPVGRRGFVRADITAGRGDTLFVRLGLWPEFIFLLVWLLGGLLMKFRLRGRDA